MVYLLVRHAPLGLTPIRFGLLKTGPRLSGRTNAPLMWVALQAEFGLPEG